MVVVAVAVTVVVAVAGVVSVAVAGTVEVLMAVLGWGGGGATRNARLW